MRKVTRKVFLENVEIFKRDAKRFELGMFDVTKKSDTYALVKINGIEYVKFYDYKNKTTLRSTSFLNFKCDI